MKPGEKPPAYEEMISDSDAGEVHDPEGRLFAPSFPFEHDGAVDEGARGRRQRLAQWLTAAENPYFARSYVNRLWSYFLGIGLIDPVDDIRW